jgi:hypothetical protein
LKKPRKSAINDAGLVASVRLYAPLIG